MGRVTVLMQRVLIINVETKTCAAKMACTNHIILNAMPRVPLQILLPLRNPLAHPFPFPLQDSVLFLSFQHVLASVKRAVAVCVTRFQELALVQITSFRIVVWAAGVPALMH